MSNQQTIPSVLQNAAEKWPEQIAIQDGDISFSFEQLQQQSLLAASALVANGLQAGDRVAIWAPNIHEWVWTALGVHIVGGVLVPLNTRYRGLEAGDILRRSQAKILFTTNGFLDTDYPALIASEELPKLEKTVLLRGSHAKCEAITDFLARADSKSSNTVDARLAALSPRDTSDILYTSGTTGAPKGVVSSHGQTVEIFTTWSNTVGLRSADRYLVVNPFFHSFGYKAGWLSCLIQGASCFPMAVYDPAQTLSMIADHAITILPGAPTIFQTLLNEPNLNTTDTSSLRCSVTGAASVPEQLVYAMKNTLGFEEVFTAYGLTECPVVSITQPGDDIALIANTAGKAIDQTEIRILDNQGQPCAANTVGAIQVRGFNVMQAYFENEAATAEAIDKDGWLDTGDLGWMDENGYIKVTDRAKDMFIVGGFNCYPAEIENLLLNHPQIIDAAVVGMPDERLGEVGCAYLVADPATDATELNHENLKQWSRTHMANFKVPRQFVLLDALPRNASGKVQKFMLAENAGTRL